jgi:acyl carrier protein
LLEAAGGEEQTMTLDATQLGIDRTMAALRDLLAERFAVDGVVDADDPLFAIGAGLSSLEGIEFLCEVEKRFGINIKDLEWWVYETPTLGAVAQHVIDLSAEQRQHARQ